MSHPLSPGGHRKSCTPTPAPPRTMSELAPAAPAAGPATAYGARTVQAWRTVLNWLAFLLQVLLQITPASLAHLLSFIGLRHLPLAGASAAAATFKPLPIQLLSPDSPAPPAAPSAADDDGGGGDDAAIADKLTVVLDLDETLVCAYETSSLPAMVHNQATDAGLTWFELECVSGDKDDEGNQKVNHVTVFERPGLHNFLEEISEFADLILFTAGLEGYASPLVDKIDLKRRFSLRLYRPSTVNTKYRQHVKDLSCLSKDMCRTVIVDNNPFSFLLQPLNGIPCVPFSAGQPFDEQLLEVLLPLLKHLSFEKDVRPVLYEKFHMPEWFQNQGIPMSDW